MSVYGVIVSPGIAALDPGLMADVADDVVKSDWLFHVVFSRDALKVGGKRL